MIETSDMQFDSRMVTAEETPEDHDVEVTLRPQTLAEYIGQDKVKENMAIAARRGEKRGLSWGITHKIVPISKAVPALFIFRGCSNAIIK